MDFGHKLAKYYKRVGKIMTDQKRLVCRMFGFSQLDTERGQKLLSKSPRLGRHVEFDQVAQLDLIDLVIINENVEELSAGWQQIQARRSSEGLAVPDALYVRDAIDTSANEARDSGAEEDTERRIRSAEFFSQQEFSRCISYWIIDRLTTSGEQNQITAGAIAAFRLVA